jgi:hypothetical protein
MSVPNMISSIDFLTGIETAVLHPSGIYIYIYVTSWTASGVVVRVLDYRRRGPGFNSRALQKK